MVLAMPIKNKVMVVLTPNENEYKGILFCLEKQNNVWKIHLSFPVTIGRTGLAWGRGISLPFEMPSKKQEGDGKSPAGLFEIEPYMFGYDFMPSHSYSWKYTELTETWVGVDDSKSKYYNQVFDAATIQDKDWDSCETMKRQDDLYSRLLIIQHNMHNTLPYFGSCIFIHLWKNENSPTAGCTAMSKENFEKMMHWLTTINETHYILQLPCQVYQQYHSTLGLPILDLN